MQRFIHGTALQREISAAASKSKRCWLVSGFIKSGFLERIKALESSDLQIYCRWRLSDLILGGSDVEAAYQTLSAGGTFAIHPRLHAKVFLFDNVAFIGSANLTASGLPTVEKTGNLEAAVVTSNVSDVVDYILAIKDESICLTDTLIQAISKEINVLKTSSLPAATEASARMPKAVERAIRQSSLSSFSGADFPWCESPAAVLIGEMSDPMVAHDIELFMVGQDPLVSELRSAFLQSRCYDWLSTQATENIRFGELTAKLHDLLNGDPKPYRKDVKRLLSNVLAWALECDPDHFKKFEHRHTASYQKIKTDLTSG